MQVFTRGLFWYLPLPHAFYVIPESEFQAVG